MHEVAEHYDLFNPRPGWRATSALIISPYVEATFFKAFTERLQPKSLHVVIDDGCRSGDIELVRKSVLAAGFKSEKKLKISLGSAPGLVHLKIFYIVWNSPGGQKRHTLICGSANATRQAFSGSLNSELLSIYRLSMIHHADAIAWCEHVTDATKANTPTKIAPSRDLKLAEGVQIRLPGLRVSPSARSAGNLDQFLQRGRLLSAYRPDPTFLAIPINLGKPLPRAELENKVVSIGFSTKETNRLKFPYITTHLPRRGGALLSIDEDEESDDESGLGNWRAKFFTWTHIGDWCSEACFQQLGSDFKKKGADLRKQALNELNALSTRTARAELRARLRAALVALSSVFGDAASAYIRIRGGGIDEEYYDKLFHERIDRDLVLAGDDEFRTRFINGYELTQVPRFRADTVGWRRFVNSFTRQLCLANLPDRSQSLMLRSVQKALLAASVDVGVYDDVAEMEQVLRRSWNRPITLKIGRNAKIDTTVGRTLAKYYL